MTAKKKADPGNRNKYDAATPCGLFFRMSEDVTGPDLLRKLREIMFVINHGPSIYKKNSHILSIPEPMVKILSDNHLKGYIEIAKAQGIVCLIEQDLKAAGKYSADGTLINDINQIDQARQCLGPEAIVGLRCGKDIDLAETATSKGADFVTFHTNNGSLPDPKFGAIWSTLSEKPCLLEGPFTNDYVETYVHSGADFLEAGPYIWGHKDGVKQGTVNIIHAIEMALEDRPASN